MKIGVVTVPFILSDYHIAQAQRTVQSLQTTCHELATIAIPNAIRSGSGDLEWLHKHFDVVIPNDENILAKAWNKGISYALAAGARYVLVANLDLRFHPQAIDRLVACAENHPEAIMWGACKWGKESTLTQARLDNKVEGGFNFSCFLVDGRLFQHVGQFDEAFAPAYQEDSDMFRRMSLAGQHGLIARDSLVFHAENGTSKGCLCIKEVPLSDRLQIVAAIKASIKKNDALYIKKWGGLPGRELWENPYNGNSPY